MKVTQFDCKSGAAGVGAQIPISYLWCLECTFGSELNWRNLCSQVKLQIACFEVGVTQGD